MKGKAGMHSETACREEMWQRGMWGVEKHGSYLESLGWNSQNSIKLYTIDAGNTIYVWQKG